MFNEELKLVPNKPGSYQMYNDNDIIIYIGKAKDLKKRLSSYFKGTNTGKTAKMVSEISYFKYIVTETELESFILELNLIKEFNPKYNILLKDDKSYPYIEYIKKPFPKLRVVRYLKIKKDKNRLIFGPYVNAYAARRIVNLINRLYPLKKCEGLPKEVCLYYHINECLGYCVNDIDEKTIKEMEEEIISFLKGNDDIIKNKLKEKLKYYSDEMNYEMANEIKKELEYTEIILEKQKIELFNKENLDVINYYKYNNFLGIEILFIRNGKLIGNYNDIFEESKNYKEELESYIALFYNKNEIPKEILIPKDLNKELLESVIITKFFIPQRGMKKRLLDMAYENAKINVSNNYEKYKNNLNKTKGALDELSKLLNINITRIDAFDNSSLFGSYSVSGMVVFINGVKKKEEYRKYKIKVDKNDDYNSMREVIYRRYSRALKDNLDLPELIIVDGGKGQINAALDSLKELNLNIKVCGLKKNNNHEPDDLIDGNTLTEYNLNKKSNLFYFLTNIQNEMHRYTINYHKQLRSKGTITSILDEVPGIGPKRKELLLKTYGSVKNIKEASNEELEKIIPKSTIKILKEDLNS